MGQINRYVVHLADKNGTPYSIDMPLEFLSIKSIERRQRQQIDITDQDLPVDPTYFKEIDNLSATIDAFYASKWFNNILIQCEAADISKILSLPYVSEVEYVAPGEKLTFEDAGASGRKNHRRRNQRVAAAATDAQNEMIGIDVMHSNGFTGEGIDIAIMDAGFQGVTGISYFSHLYNENKLKFTYDFVTNGSNVYQYSDHGTKVLSTLSGFSPGEFIGGAYDANYLLFITEDVCNSCEHRIEEYNWVYAAEFADSAGVDIISTSLGYNLFEDPDMDYTIEDLDGETAVITIAGDIAASKGILVVSSAGNEGNNSWGYITAPADGNAVLAIGNVDLTGKRWRSSSHGFSADGRIKPDLAAPGAGVAVINKSGNIVGGTGTSFSAPMVAGLAAGAWQSNPNLTAQELRFFLTRSASQAAFPDSLLGFGIPHFDSFINLLSFAEKDANFTLYPNPITDHVIIRVNNPNEVTEADLKIFDSQGHLVMETDLSFGWNNLTQVIDMRALRAGTYIFNLVAGGKVDEIRIVKI